MKRCMSRSYATRNPRRYTDESTGSPLHGEDQHSRRSRYSEQSLLPSSVPRSMRRASNLSRTRSAPAPVSGTRPRGALDSGSCDLGPTKVLQTCRFATEPESLVNSGSQVRVVALQKT